MNKQEPRLLNPLNHAPKIPPFKHLAENRLMASILPQHYSFAPENEEDVEIPLFMPTPATQPLIAAIKEVAFGDGDVTAEEVVLSSKQAKERMRKCIILELCTWQEPVLDETDYPEGMTTYATPLNQLQPHSIHSAIRRTLENCIKDIPMYDKNTCQGMSFTTLRVNRGLDSPIPNEKCTGVTVYRTFVNLNHEYVSLKFNILHGKKAPGLIISRPVPTPEYPWHAHLLSNTVVNFFRNILLPSNN